MLVWALYTTVLKKYKVLLLKRNHVIFINALLIMGALVLVATFFFYKDSFQSIGMNNKINSTEIDYLDLDNCGLPKALRETDYLLLASGLYEGADSTQVETRNPVTDVFVEKNTKPVVLVLSAYSTNEWHIHSNPEDNNIYAVVVIGYEDPVVLTDDDHLFVTKITPKDAGCYMNTFRDNNVSQLNDIVARFSNQKVAMFYSPKTDGLVYFDNIDAIESDNTHGAVKARVELHEVSEIKATAEPHEVLEVKVKAEPKKAPIANETAKQLPDIAAALVQGSLRVSTQADIEEFEKAYRNYVKPESEEVPTFSGSSTSSSTANGNNRKLYYYHSSRTYVITENYSFPDNLGGANAGLFFLPEGVPYPQGDMGHSSLLNMNDGSCRGLCYGFNEY